MMKKSETWEQVACLDSRWREYILCKYFKNCHGGDGGYYYRVHAEHIAGPADGEKDTGDSITDGIKIN